MSDIFALASRLKLRFETKQGTLSIEDLWSLPLETTRTNVTSLDEIAISLDKAVKDAGTTSFVRKTTKTNEVLNLKFEVVKYVIGVLVAEQEEAEVKRANADKKQQLLTILAQKENEAMATQSVEQLRAAIAAL